MISLTRERVFTRLNRPVLSSRKPVTFDVNLNNPDSVAALVDHTLLKPEAPREDVLRVCREARELTFASVCINPFWVRTAADALAGSEIRVCTVVGFPLGANEPLTKIQEAKRALSGGAKELDVVQNIGALCSGDRDVVRDEIRELADLAHSAGAILKVILETCLLNDEQKVIACHLAVDAGADFVKTSTGFSTGGATVEDVMLMRRTVGSGIGVKASGGVRTLRALRQMIAAGANRIGTSSGVHIVRELRAELSQQPHHTGAAGASRNAGAVDQSADLSEAKARY